MNALNTSADLPDISDTPAFDVAIIGSGIAGSALACALKNSPLSVVLIESGRLPDTIPACDNHINGFDARVSAMSLASENFLQELGIWPVIKQRRLQEYQSMMVWDGEGTAEIDFHADEVHSHHLGSIVENRVMVQALVESLQMSKVKLLDQAKVSNIAPINDGDYCHLITLEKERQIQVKAKLIVGADGANSFVRSHFGLKTREWDYQHNGIVCTIETQKPHQNTAWQRFMSTGPLAFLPLSSNVEEDKHFCSIVWSAETEKAEALMALDDESFKQELAEKSEFKLGEILACSRRFSFPLRQRHAINYIDDGVALVADAAHTIHPLAGQGINIGLLDVKVLAEELIKADKLQHRIGDTRVLSRYQRRRKTDNLLMMSVMEGFKRLFGQQNLAISWIRNRGMAAVGRHTLIKRQLIKQAIGLTK
ncbi:MAG: UbiH/UbiF/VisC/COQ6 family ubiquinone biosynthesis hydroxylase [Pseudomonadales bacterium]|nr:UbiH/UbiF/VisC/COQ6 family ubiquinone biosynthesis hydroxylase [Pseudomonadales bacterium]